MVRTTSGIGVHSLLQELCELYLVSHDGARHHDRLATNDDDLLSLKELLGNYAGKTTKKMALAIDDGHPAHLLTGYRLHRIGQGDRLAIATHSFITRAVATTVAECS